MKTLRLILRDGRELELPPNHNFRVAVPVPGVGNVDTWLGVDEIARVDLLDDGVPQPPPNVGPAGVEQEFEQHVRAADGTIVVERKPKKLLIRAPEKPKAKRKVKS
jgi:hypothetical protein